MSAVSDLIAKRRPSTNLTESGATPTVGSVIKQQRKQPIFGTLLFDSIQGDMDWVDDTSARPKVEFVSTTVFTDSAGRAHHNVSIKGKGFEFIAGFLPKYAPKLGEYTISARINSKDSTKVDIIVH